MMKRLAAAVMYAALTLSGNSDTDVLSPDSDSDAILDDYSDSLASANLLAVASRACGDRIDAAWVGYHEHAPTAAVAVRFDSEQVALVNLIVRSVDLPSFEEATRLLHSALPRCRAAGALKVRIKSEGIEMAAVRPVVERHGFRFSRVRSIDETLVMEFYTDLYWKGEATGRNIPHAA